MKTIKVNEEKFEVDKYYKEGAYAFFSCSENPYKKDTKKHNQWGFGFDHASQGILSKEIAYYFLNNDKGHNLNKQSLLNELEAFSKRIPRDISNWDAVKTRQWKDALKSALSKKKSNALVLNNALHILRGFYE